MATETCSLRIGDVIVLRAEGGAPEAEYALFDEGDVELATTTGRTLLETSYRTTVGAARDRLRFAGVSTEMANEAARVLRRDLATRYARGPIAWKVAEHLGPAELFEGQTFNGKTRRYLGRWLDLEALAVDARLLRATTAIQALHLIALLDECDDRIPIVLTTAEIAKSLPPGQRTYRRCDISHAGGLAAALDKLHKNPFPRTATRDQGRSLDHLLDVVRRKMSLAGTPSAQARLMKVERALTMRDRPKSGPLANPELWALETRLALGDHNDVVADVHAFEQLHGRSVGTSYLRAFAALVAGTMEPRALAVNVSSLASASHTLPELSLLAARAWGAAGDMSRGLAYTRDLLGDPNADNDLKQLARELTADLQANRSVHYSSFPVSGPAYAGGSASSPPAAAKSTAAYFVPRHAAVPETDADPESRAPDTAIEPMPVVSITPPPPSFNGIDPLPQARVETSRVSRRDPRSEPPDSSERPAPVSTRPSRRPPAPTLDLGPPPGNPADWAQRRRTPYPPAVRAQTTPPMGESRASRASQAPTPQPPIAANIGYSHVPPAYSSAMPSPSRPPESMHPMPDPTTPSIPDDMADSGDDERTVAIVRRAPATPIAAVATSSASDTGGYKARQRLSARPAFMAERAPPPPMSPELAGPRQLDTGLSEYVDTLSIPPPGLPGAPPPLDFIPGSEAEARIAFTCFSRDLARELKVRFNVVCKTDVATVEVLQRSLRERFPSGEVSSRQEVIEVRRHAALLSELLVRVMGSYWIDIFSGDLADWAMFVPPGTRVWPFARVMRYVVMGDQETDLVSYYLELEARALRA